MALVQASGYSSDWTPSLGTSVCRMGAALEKTRKKKCQISFKSLINENQYNVPTCSKENLKHKYIHI